MTTKNNIYIKVLNEFKDLIKGNVKEVKITVNEMIKNRNRYLL